MKTHKLLKVALTFVLLLKSTHGRAINGAYDVNVKCTVGVVAAGTSIGGSVKSLFEKFREQNLNFFFQGWSHNRRISRRLPVSRSRSEWWTRNWLNIRQHNRNWWRRYCFSKSVQRSWFDLLNIQLVIIKIKVIRSIEKP